MKRFIGICLLVFLSACAPRELEKRSSEAAEKKEDVEEPAATTYRTVGRIASVDQAEGFALIQQYTRSVLAEGSILTSYGPEGKRANLRVSGEKMGLFSVADIQSGEVAVGDPVQVLLMAAATPKEAEKESGTPVRSDQDEQEVLKPEESADRER